MAANETMEQLEKDLNQNVVEINGKCGDDQLKISEQPAKNSRDVTEAASCASPLESGEQNNAVVSNGNAVEEVNVDDHESPLQMEDVNGGDAVTSSDAVADDCLPLRSQDDSVDVVMDGSEEASADTTPVLPEQTDSDDVPSLDAVSDQFSEMRARKESLQRLCDVLMEERDQATRALKEKDDEVLRLRKRLLESEAEKESVKTQLGEALDRSGLAEKKVISEQEENTRLQTEITRLTKKVEQLETENGNLKSQLQQTSITNGVLNDENKIPLESETVTLSYAGEPASDVLSTVDGAEDKSQEIPDIGTKESEIADEPKRADGTKNHESDSSNEEVVRRRERAAKRTAPNFYRHSFAGSLPRPYHSFELPRQGSVSREDGARNERSGSFHSDTSGESESSESGIHSVSGLPSFMRRSDKPTFRKSGYSPVQFSFQPLPESITHRRESWDATRYTRPRGGSLSRAREGSESESSGIGSLSSVVHNENELNSAPDHLDGGQGENNEEVESEKGSVTVHVSSLPSTDSHSNAENSQNSEDLISGIVISIDESPPNVSLQNGEKLDSNWSSQDQEHPEEDEKKESVSELVNIWNKRTTEVLDV